MPPRLRLDRGTEHPFEQPEILRHAGSRRTFTPMERVFAIRHGCTGHVKQQEGRHQGGARQPRIYGVQSTRSKTAGVRSVALKGFPLGASWDTATWAPDRLPWSPSWSQPLPVAPGRTACQDGRLRPRRFDLVVPREPGPRRLLCVRLDPPVPQRHRHGPLPARGQPPAHRLRPRGRDDPHHPEAAAPLRLGAGHEFGSADGAAAGRPCRTGRDSVRHRTRRRCGYRQPQLGRHLHPRSARPELAGLATDSDRDPVTVRRSRPLRHPPAAATAASAARTGLRGTTTSTATPPHRPRLPGQWPARCRRPFPPRCKVTTTSSPTRTRSGGPAGSPGRWTTDTCLAAWSARSRTPTAGTPFHEGRGPAVNGPE